MSFVVPAWPKTTAAFMPRPDTALFCIEASPEKTANHGRLAATAGLRHLVSHDEKHALSRLDDTTEYAVIVIAQDFPGGDPLQMIDYCRAVPRLSTTPIAFVMNQRDLPLARNAMDAGATEVFLADEQEQLLDFLRDYARAAEIPSYSGKVLLVEDDEVHAAYIGGLCESLGFEVRCVDEAEKAVEALKSETFHLLLTDVVLRGTKTGIALIRQVRQDLGLQLPIIVMSGFDDLPRRLLALRNAVGDFIAKPFAPEEFVWRVQRVLQQVAYSEAGRPEAQGENGVRPDLFQALSPREYEICQAVLKGKSDKEIAGDLGISYWTVRSHVQQIFSKTGAINRRELMARQIVGN